MSTSQWTCSNLKEETKYIRIGINGRIAFLRRIKTELTAEIEEPGLTFLLM